MQVAQVGVEAAPLVGAVRLAGLDPAPQVAAPVQVHRIEVPPGDTFVGGSETTTNAISAGVMLYVATTDLIPEINGERHVAIPLTVAAGIGIFVLTRSLLP